MPYRFAKFYHLSTGYIEGTIPPQFDPARRKPIEACGSDSVLPLDGRWSIARCIENAKSVCEKRGYIGFKILRHNPRYSGDFELSHYVAVKG